MVSQLWDFQNINHLMTDITFEELRVFYRRSVYSVVATVFHNYPL